jgi:penicillin amidase
MSRAGRFFLLLVGVILLLSVVAAVLGFIYVRRPFPQTEGEMRLAGLDSTVEVYRDTYGIPHIYAKTSHDLFMAQGFVHAQDRFWQMEFSRRVGMGLLSEVLGAPALETDKFIRTLGWHRTAAQGLESLVPEEIAVLQAYADGVNAYLHLRQGRLGLEFTVLGLTGAKFEPEPWIPLNTLTWAKMMAWDLGGNMNRELARAHIAARLGAPAVDELISSYPEEHPYIVQGTLSSATLDSVPDEVFTFHPFGFGDGIGSNNWVIAGNRTETGSPLLANDPHLGIQIPSIWYEIGLHCDPLGPQCPYNVVGASFASAPGVIIGHNDNIAWGVTNLGPDVQDLFIERLNPDNPNQYEFEGEWRDLEIIREEIQVAGEDEPVVILVRHTHHGPIINDTAGGTEDEWSFGWQPLALSWTALQPSSVLSSVLMINRAEDWQSFREALRYWDVPSQNFVYADAEGNIGYQAPGRIPIRASGDGAMPVPGWTGEHEWADTIPFNKLPNAFNPPEGYIITANNAVVSQDFPYFLSKDWAPGYRAQRIQDLIESDDSLSLAELQDIQFDPSLLYAQDVLPYFEGLNPSEPALAQALNLLLGWDGRAVRDSSGAALFETLRIKLVDAVFADELGEQLLDKLRGDLSISLVGILPNPEARWFDDVKTETVESRDEILQRALEMSVQELNARLGTGPENWRWGDLHTATFVNQPLGQSGIAPVEALFNRGPVEVDGAIGTLNNTAYSMSNPFSVVTVPSYRQIIDLDDLGKSVSMHTTGQSGHPFHGHYDDMIDPWRNGGYHPMLWNRQLIETVAESHLTLRP